MRLARTNRIALAILCTIGLGGCASVQIGRAQTLAAAGVAASTSLASAQATASSSFDADRETEGLQDAMLGAPASPDDPEAAKVAAQLAARRDVAAHLEDAYASFQALSRYDASGEFKTSADALFDAVNAAAGLSGTATTVEQTFEAAGAGILGSSQARKLKLASAVLRKALSGYQVVLIHDAPALIAIEASAVRAHYVAVDLLWRSGMLSSEGLIADLVPEDGLALAGGAETFTNADPKAASIVAFEMRTREQRQISAIAAAQQQQQALIASLIRQHVAFEHGAPLTLAELGSAADELASSISAIAQTRKETAK